MKGEYFEDNEPARYVSTTLDRPAHRILDKARRKWDVTKSAALRRILKEWDESKTPGR